MAYNEQLDPEPDGLAKAKDEKLNKGTKRQLVTVPKIILGTSSD